MDYQTSSTTTRMHPLMIGAAASVVLVSLLGAAAITGILPSSHSTPTPTNLQPTASLMTPGTTQTVTPVSATRFVTADGRVLEEVSNAAQTAPVSTKTAAAVSSSEKPITAYRKPLRHVVHHHHQQVALNESAPRYETPVYQAPQVQQESRIQQVQQQPVYQPQPQPASVFGNVNPVQTGVGAVIGGLLGSQVGKGNGRTLATVAGVIAGGYAGNEISHGRSPVPTW